MAPVIAKFCLIGMFVRREQAADFRTGGRVAVDPAVALLERERGAESQRMIGSQKSGSNPPRM